jgi:DNA-binding transcriptional LysR family regulator
VLNPAGAALLRSVQSALSQLDDGVQAAAAAASGVAQRLRVTVLPSFAQRWLLPRMGRWRDRHPNLALEIDASHQLVDLQREGFHAGLRQGRGPWPGLESERLFDMPMPLIVVGSPSAARRLLGAQPEALAREPLLDDSELWERWFAAAGLRTQVTPGGRAESGLGAGPRAAGSRCATGRTTRQAVAAVDHARRRYSVPLGLSVQSARLAASRSIAAVAARRARIIAQDLASSVAKAKCEDKKTLTKPA